MWSAALLFGGMALIAPAAPGPVHSDQDIIEPNPTLYPHVHASSIAALPNGDLLACWYSGKTDKSSDVAIVGARLKKGAKRWGTPFVMADTPDLSDNNPVLYLDKAKRLWIIWSCLTQGSWDTAIVKYKQSRKYGSDPIAWGPESALDLAPLLKQYPEAGLGWMTRNHPIEIAGGRMLLPLYSDRFDNSIMALTANAGAAWSFSEPMGFGLGDIQPTVIVRRDKSLLAYMRDGSERHRVWMSTSSDGVEWTKPVQIELPNPGSALEMIRLRSGRLVLAFNSTETDRSVLTLALSDDDGRTWPARRDLRSEPGRRFDYPSVVQTPDGNIHVTYSADVKSIRHAVVNEAWILEGAARTRTGG